MWSALASILLGVFGWVIPKLLIEPGKEIFDLRREVQESLIVYGDLSKDAPADERRAAIACEIGSGGKRQLVIRAGKSHKFTIPEDEVPR